MTATLRPATDGDALACAVILREWIDETDWFTSPHPKSSDSIFVLRKIREGFVTVAEQQGVAGFLALENGYVSCLYVRHAARGVGIGRRLLDLAKAQSSRLSLWTFQANTRAQKFYLREGFREVQRTDGAENEEGLPDIEYLWEAAP